MVLVMNSNSHPGTRFRRFNEREKKQSNLLSFFSEGDCGDTELSVPYVFSALQPHYFGGLGIVEMAHIVGARCVLLRYLIVSALSRNPVPEKVIR